MSLPHRVTTGTARSLRSTVAPLAAVGLLLTVSACSGGDTADADAPAEAVTAGADWADLAASDECAELRETYPELVAGK